MFIDFPNISINDLLEEPPILMQHEVREKETILARFGDKDSTPQERATAYAKGLHASLDKGITFPGHFPSKAYICMPRFLHNQEKVASFKGSPEESLRAFTLHKSCLCGDALTSETLYDPANIRIHDAVDILAQLEKTKVSSFMVRLKNPLGVD